MAKPLVIDRASVPWVIESMERKGFKLLHGHRVEMVYTGVVFKASILQDAKGIVVASTYTDPRGRERLAGLAPIQFTSLKARYGL